MSFYFQLRNKGLGYSATGCKDQRECQNWKGTNTIDSPPTSAPLLSFSIQGPWARCQLWILRTHSKNSKERDLFKTRIHSLTVSCFSLHFPCEEGLLVAVFSDIPNEEGREDVNGGVGGVRFVIHVTSRQIGGLWVLWVSDFPSEPSFSLPVFILVLLPVSPTFAPAHIVTPPPTTHCLSIQY